MTKTGTTGTGHCHVRPTERTEAARRQALFRGVLGGAGDWALAQLAERERVLGSRTRAVAAATRLQRGVCALAGGAGLTRVAWAGAAALRVGRIGPVELGVLVFLALGVGALLQGLPGAVGRLPISRASLERLAGLGWAPCPVAAQAPTILTASPARHVGPAPMQHGTGAHARPCSPCCASSTSPPGS